MHKVRSNMSSALRSPTLGCVSFVDKDEKCLNDEASTVHANGRTLADNTHELVCSRSRDLLASPRCGALVLQLNALRIYLHRSLPPLLGGVSTDISLIHFFLGHHHPPSQTSNGLRQPRQQNFLLLKNEPEFAKASSFANEPAFTEASSVVEHVLYKKLSSGATIERTTQLAVDKCGATVENSVLERKKVLLSHSKRVSRVRFNTQEDICFFREQESPLSIHTPITEDQHDDYLGGEKRHYIMCSSSCSDQASVLKDDPCSAITTLMDEIYKLSKYFTMSDDECRKEENRDTCDTEKNSCGEEKREFNDAYTEDMTREREEFLTSGYTQNRTYYIQSNTG